MDAKSKILESKSNSNLLLEIIQEVYGESSERVCGAIATVQEIFCTFIERGEFCDDIKSEHDAELNSEEKYKQWLLDCYTDVTTYLLSIVEDSESKIQNTSCICLSAFVQSEIKTKRFSDRLLKDFLGKLLNKEIKMNHAISSCGDFNSASVIKIVVNQLKQNQTPTEAFLWNTYFFLTHIQLGDIHQVPKTEKNRDMARKMYSNAWLHFLKHKLPLPLYKKVLIALYEKVLQQLWNPLLMTDFLTESYNIGGVVSLLALNGIFFLMQRFNLEYPNFYPKLYSLLDDEMLYVKYRARFFFLTDLFLSSTHLPAYLVAAFAKKLSRLALTAPVDALVIIIPLIRNLLVRHPTLHFLVHREHSEVTSDPYLPSEELANCNALKSSLWELKSLQNHWHPDIAIKACFINKPLPSIEWDLSNLLETGYTELLEKEYKFEIKDDIPILY